MNLYIIFAISIISGMAAKEIAQPKSEIRKFVSYVHQLQYETYDHAIINLSETPLKMRIGLNAEDILLNPSHELGIMHLKELSSFKVMLDRELDTQQKEFFITGRDGNFILFNRTKLKYQEILVENDNEHLEKLKKEFEKNKATFEEYDYCVIKNETARPIQIQSSDFQKTLNPRDCSIFMYKKDDYSQSLHVFCEDTQEKLPTVFPAGYKKIIVYSSQKLSIKGSLSYAAYRKNMLLKATAIVMLALFVFVIMGFVKFYFRLFTNKRIL